MSRGTLLGMGERVRSRVLRALGLANVWVQLEALSVRLQRVEEVLRELQEPVSQELIDRVRGRLSEPPRPQTLRAAPPPPSEQPWELERQRHNAALQDMLAAHRDGKKS